MDSTEIFGGKVIVFGGDFRQVLPVVPHGTRAETVNVSFAKSYLWSKIEKLKLTRNMRARLDDGFSGFLLRAGNGVEPTISESRIFYSFDKAEDENNNCYEEEFLNTLSPNGLPHHKLELKVNCPIMLPGNLNPSIGLCNGTRMVCKGFDKNVIYAEITTGQHTGEKVLLPRIPLKPTEDKDYPFKFIRKQFPIRLCFAMTVNKAQGQTIPHVGVYLPNHVFSHGQLYVALSRGISMATTKVLVKTENSIKENETYTKNVVYKEVLLSET
ncbi:ATP-dependent DNA helicase PIF6-like [Durio zibethinus]|uniref:ATP-dependent DNA helicase n=1 Tax=Durio zibethinus TaxID=66656 RepID=A0A6P5X9Z3_DURZI|nr:ATP-dependent DNA helicase PIF6-like [Durio zibethinus]